MLRRDLIALVACAFALRTLLAAMTPVIGADASGYLLYADDIRHGIWGEGLRRGIHPGYPLAILGLDVLIGDLERSGYAVSVIASSLAVIPLFLLVRDLGDRRIAILSGLLYACLSDLIRIQADAMTEGLFHFLFLSSVAFAWFGAKRWWLYLAAGGAGAAAFYVRPEGIYLAFVILLAGRKRLLPAVAGAVLLVALAAPLAARYERRESIRLALSGNRDWANAAAKMAYRTVREPLWAGAVGLAVVLLVARKRIRPGYLCAIAIAYPVPVLVAASAGHPITSRYLALSVILLLPFAAAAAVVLGSRRPRLASALAALVLTLTAAHGTRPRREKDVPLKEAALWLRDRAPEARVYSNTDQVAYYLGKRSLSLPKTAEQIESMMLPEGAVIVIDVRDFRKQWPAAMGALERTFRRMAEFVCSGGQVAVYRR